MPIIPPEPCPACDDEGGSDEDGFTGSTPCPACGRIRARRSDAGKPRRPSVARDERRQYTFTFAHAHRLVIDFDPTAGKDNWDDPTTTMLDGHRRTPVAAFRELTRTNREEELAGTATRDISIAPPGVSITAMELVPDEPASRQTAARAGLDRRTLRRMVARVIARYRQL